VHRQTHYAQTHSLCTDKLTMHRHSLCTDKLTMHRHAHCAQTHSVCTDKLTMHRHIHCAKTHSLCTDTHYADTLTGHRHTHCAQTHYAQTHSRCTDTLTMHRHTHCEQTHSLLIPKSPIILELRTIFVSQSNLLLLPFVYFYPISVSLYNKSSLCSGRNVLALRVCLLQFLFSGPKKTGLGLV
jgi:hypothetical protein